jgi:opine dehydrogenase
MNIGVMGCGPAGLALYAMMLNANYNVLLYSHADHTGSLSPIIDADGNFELECSYQKASAKRSLRLEPTKLTMSIEELVASADVLYNTTPINAHRSIFDQVRAACHAQGRRVLLIHLSGGFSIFSDLLSIASDNSVRVASAHTLPYASRVEGGVVRILNIRKHTQMWFSEPGDVLHADVLGELFGTTIEVAKNPLEASLDRSSYVMHPVITLFNLTRIEGDSEFFFYRHGFSNSILRILIDAGEERQQLARRLGFVRYPNPRDRLKAFNDNYSSDFRDIRGPSSIRHRFITEDIPYGLVPICGLGEALGLEMPVCKAIVDIASAASGLDLWESPFNLKTQAALREEMLSYKGA